MNMLPHFGRMNNNYINFQNKSEMNTSSQKGDVIDHTVCLSTVEIFTDLGHVLIIFDNTIWFIWL